MHKQHTLVMHVILVLDIYIYIYSRLMTYAIKYATYNVSLQQQTFTTLARSVLACIHHFLCLPPLPPFFHFSFFSFFFFSSFSAVPRRSTKLLITLLMLVHSWPVQLTRQSSLVSVSVYLFVCLSTFSMLLSVCMSICLYMYMYVTRHFEHNYALYLIDLYCNCMYIQNMYM